MRKLALAFISAALIASPAVAQFVGPNGGSGGGGGTGNTTISPATGNTTGDCLQLSGTTTVATDAGFPCLQPSTQLSHATGFTLTAGQWALNDPVLATGTLTETFPATSTLSANGGQVLQNSGTSTITIQPNAADQVCPAGGACGMAGAALALTANYGALVQTDGAGHLYVQPLPPSSVSCPTCTTSAAALTANQLVIGAGLQAEQTLGSLGTTTTVLHGNAGGAPTFGAVALATDVTGILPAADGGAGTINGILKANGSGVVSGATASDIPATTLTTGTSVSLTGPRQYYVCTGTCTVTPPVPVAGYEFCVMNDDNISTVITLAALGSSARYEATARTSYGTAGTGTLVSGGAAKDQICIVGRDSTHYLTTSSTGTWTLN